MILIAGPFSRSVLGAVHGLRADIKFKLEMLKSRLADSGKTVGHDWIASPVQPAADGCTIGAYSFSLLKHMRFEYKRVISQEDFARRSGLIGVGV